MRLLPGVEDAVIPTRPTYEDGYQYQSILGPLITVEVGSLARSFVCANRMHAVVLHAFARAVGTRRVALCRQRRTSA